MTLVQQTIPLPKQAVQAASGLDSPELEANGAVRGLDLERLHGRHANRLRDAVGDLLVDGSKHGHCRQQLSARLERNREQVRRTLPGLDLAALGVLEVDSDVVHEVLLVGVAEDLLPECTGLLEVD